MLIFYKLIVQHVFKLIVIGLDRSDNMTFKNYRRLNYIFAVWMKVHIKGDKTCVY